MSNYMIKLKFELENDSPFWSGKNEEIKIDAEEIRVFGSSIFGAIKSSLNIEKSEKFKNCIQCIFGSDSQNQFQESKVFVSDMIEKEKIKINSRAGIRIDNTLGSTIKGGLYDSTLIPKGNKFEFRMEAREICKYGKAVFEEALEEIIKNMQNGKVTFGGNKTKGFGIFKINKVWKKDFDLHKKEDLIEYLDWEDSIQLPVYIENSSEKSNNLKYDITFTGNIKDSFLLKGEIENRENEKGSLQHSLKENDLYIIPSGSIKGSMRAYTEKIMNTLHGEKEHEVIRELFGHKSDEKNHDKYQMGKLIISDCKIEKVEKVGTTEYHRIKIDRFTGGAINGALINEKRLVDGVIDLKIQVRESLEPQEKALILFYLRDLGLGKITLGSNASVGSGRVEGIKIDFVDDVFLQFKDGNIDKDKSKNIDNISAYLEELNRGVNA